MATKKGLALPTIEVNDRVISYKPNSLTYKGGLGDLVVRHQTAGEGVGEEVLTEDAETKIGMVKFTLLAETGNTDLANEWMRASRDLAGVTIRLSAEGFTRSFRNMRVTTEPEISLGSEGEFEIEFMGGVAS